MKFDSMITTVSSEIKEMRRHAKKGWMPPSTYSNSMFLPWVAGKAREICLMAIEYLEKDARASGPLAKDVIGSKMAELQLPKRLRSRHWAAKPGELKGIAAKQSIDICLHVRAGGAKDADKVLIVGGAQVKTHRSYRKKRPLNRSADTLGRSWERSLSPSYACFHAITRSYAHLDV